MVRYVTCLALLLGACATSSPDSTSVEKSDLSGTAGKADTNAVSKLCKQIGLPANCDLCDAAGWYGDGECDTFCDLPDSDCGAADGGCSPVVCALACEYGFVEDGNGCFKCECAPPPACLPVVCDIYCPFGHKVDSAGCEVCECDDGGDRTPTSGGCAKSSNEACSSDADCVIGGCGAELCYAAAGGVRASTCECAGPGAPVGGCGCVNGACTWWQ